MAVRGRTFARGARVEAGRSVGFAASSAWFRSPARLVALIASMMALLLVAALTDAPASASATGGKSIFFGGSGYSTEDLARIRIDDPTNSDPGPELDVGVDGFTIEFYLRALAADNSQEGLACGANEDWRRGNIIIDRERAGQHRDYGVSLAGGKVVFGASTTSMLSICGEKIVTDGLWHHVAVQYDELAGKLAIYVDGKRDASGTIASGDVSYPDNGTPGLCGAEQCPDTYLYFGAGKRYPAKPYRGFLDELRFSRIARYQASFARPTAAFVPDATTVALYHFDKTGIMHDSAGGQHAEIVAAGDFPSWSADEPFVAGAGTRTPTTDSRSPGTDSQTPPDKGNAPPGGFTVGGAPDPVSGGAAPTTSPPANTVAKIAPRPSSSKGADPAIPPIMIALIGLGFAIFIAARFLRTDRL